MPSHPKLAAEFVKNKDRAHWHDQSLWFVRSKRDKAAKQIPEWELLREQASKMKKEERKKKYKEKEIEKY